MLIFSKNYILAYCLKLIFIAILFVSFPYFSFAADPLVPCGTSQGAPCEFKDLAELFSRVMNFLLFTVMVPLAVLSIAFVGFQYLTAVGNPSKLAKAHDVLWDVLFGIFIALAAWLIINTIFSVLTGNGLPSITG
jgi:type IV secretory pathway VirB2 component (pilin)